MTIYEIHPTVESDGTPTWALRRTLAVPFYCDVTVVATNRDRSALEKAMDHLRLPAEQLP